MKYFLFVGLRYTSLNISDRLSENKNKHKNRPTHNN